MCSPLSSFKVGTTSELLVAIHCWLFLFQVQWTQVLDALQHSASINCYALWIKLGHDFGLYLPPCGVRISLQQLDKISCLKTERCLPRRCWCAMVVPHSHHLGTWKQKHVYSHCKEKEEEKGAEEEEILPTYWCTHKETSTPAFKSDPGSFTIQQKRNPEMVPQIQTVFHSSVLAYLLVRPISLISQIFKFSWFSSNCSYFLYQSHLIHMTDNAVVVHVLCLFSH